MTSFDKRHYLETRDRYQSDAYASQYKEDYTGSFIFQNFRDRTIAKREIYIVKSMLQAIADIKGSCLDIPCGTGKLGKTLSRLPVHTIAGDVAHEMMSLAKNEYSAEKFLGFVRFDAMKLPFQDNSIYNIVCLRLFQRIPYEARICILKEFSKVLKGNLIVSYSYKSKFQTYRNKIKRLYDRKKQTFFQTNLKAIQTELEEAKLKIVKQKLVLFGLSSEIIIHAKK